MVNPFPVGICSRLDFYTRSANRLFSANGTELATLGRVASELREEDSFLQILIDWNEYATHSPAVDSCHIQALTAGILPICA